MASVYTDVNFSNAKMNGITANKLNLLRDDLSTAIGSLSGGGIWTSVGASLGGGWSAPITVSYQLLGGMVFFKGMLQAAYSALGTVAFTVTPEARPAAERRTMLAGAQNTGTPSDVASYIAQVLPSGVCTIYFLGAGPFVWADPSKTQQVYLDGLSYSL